MDANNSFGPRPPSPPSPPPPPGMFAAGPKGHVNLARIHVSLPPPPPTRRAPAGGSPSAPALGVTRMHAHAWRLPLIPCMMMIQGGRPESGWHRHPHRHANRVSGSVRGSGCMARRNVIVHACPIGAAHDKSHISRGEAFVVTSRGHVRGLAVPRSDLFFFACKLHSIQRITLPADFVRVI